MQEAREDLNDWIILVHNKIEEAANKGLFKFVIGIQQSEIRTDN